MVSEEGGHEGGENGGTAHLLHQRQPMADLGATETQHREYRDHHVDLGGHVPREHEIPDDPQQYEVHGQGNDPDANLHEIPPGTRPTEPVAHSPSESAFGKAKRTH